MNQEQPLRPIVISEVGENNFVNVPMNKISKNQLKLLSDYKDKSLIISIVSKKSYDFFSTIKTFVNIPLILSSSALAILNSYEFTTQEMKIPNIVINSITGLTLAMISNFKIDEKMNIYKNVYRKMSKLNHRIEESMINNESNNNIEMSDIKNYISEYESITEQIEQPFPNHIKKKIFNIYKDKNISLPLSLLSYDDMEIKKGDELA